MSECPNAAEHTPAPGGYLAWHSWAAEASKKHRSTRCRGCGLYKIWVSKVPGTPLRLPKFEVTCLT